MNRQLEGRVGTEIRARDAVDADELAKSSTALIDAESLTSEAPELVEKAWKPATALRSCCYWSAK
uniref:Uncharacterized protein n=1 Tax=Ficus carica TaxID=3494 RepID=A0AA88E7Z5_FICCA|nr:hypothetical protein TIFTF001_038837 [Ficus carica]GMN69798.1 hypothetical protein TIFTF001_038843 [Ficus carica]